MKLLLENGADVSLKDVTQSTALHVAAGYGRCACVRMLLEAHADVDARDAGGSTALHVAAQQGQCEVRGRRSTHTHTPCLPLTSRASLPQALSILFAGGADINARDREGKKASDRAAENGQREAVKVIHNVGFGGT